MSNATTDTKGTVLGVAPVLCVTAMKEAIAYLVDRLGFSLQGKAGDPPSWASLRRDGVAIMLIGGDYPAPAQDWAAYFFVRDADALFSEFQARGADLASPPQDKPYNNREFAVRLPDGHQLAFGSDLGGT